MIDILNLNTLLPRPADGACVLCAEELDLEVVRKCGVPIELPALGAEFRERGWTPALWEKVPSSEC